jgi:hypothetical protein
MVVPESFSAKPTISSMSCPLSRNRADDIGLKQMAARSPEFRPSSVWSVTAVVEIANSRSSVGFWTLVRPRIASRRPIR